MVTIAEFQNNGYIVNGGGRRAPERLYGTHQEHHRVRYGQNSGHVVVASNVPNLRQIDITAGADTVYLPYYQTRIASVRLPNAGPDFFVTDNMSGCAFFLGRTAHGNLVAFHANSQLGSSQAEMTGRAPSFQKREATVEIDTLLRLALNYYPGMTMQAVLKKSTYLRNVDALTGNADNFYGGTTVAGFRGGGGWEFWVQNWGTVSGSVVGLIGAPFKFYG